MITICIGALSSISVSASASNGALQNVNGVWYYMSSDTVIYDYEGLAPYNDEFYYVSNGRINWATPVTLGMEILNVG